MPPRKTNTKVSTKAQSESESDKDSDNEKPVIVPKQNKAETKPVKPDFGSDSESGSESESEHEEKEVKTKKSKDKNEELLNIIEVFEKLDLLKQEYELKEKEYKKIINTYFKKIKNKKEKKEGKKTNYKEELVPDVLITFLELEKNTNMSRNAVISSMHTKFKELKLKTGSIARLDKHVIKTLKLDKAKYKEDQEFGFGEFSSFVRSFYPSKTVIEVE